MSEKRAKKPVVGTARIAVPVPPPFVDLPSAPYDYQQREFATYAVVFGPAAEPSDAERNELRQALQNFA